MQSVRLLILYGSHAAKGAARIILENQPNVRRIDILKKPHGSLRLIMNPQIDEISLIPLLASSGISGFRLI